MTGRVFLVEVRAGHVRGRHRLGWMVGVKMALGSRRMTVEAAQQCTKIERSEETRCICKSLNFTRQFWQLVPVFFRTAFPCSGSLSP